MKRCIGVVLLLLVIACADEPFVYHIIPIPTYEGVSLYSCQDATVYRDMPDLNLGTTTASNECIRICDVDYRIFYIDFDDVLPMECVETCSLVMYCTYATGGMPCSLAYDCGPACSHLISEIGIYEVLEPWDESTITWNTQPAVADSPLVVYASDNEYFHKVSVIFPYWPEYGVMFKGISEWVARCYIPGENIQVMYFSPELYLIHSCGRK